MGPPPLSLNLPSFSFTYAFQGKLVEAAQTKMLQKSLGNSIEDGSTWAFFAAHFADEPPLQQAVQGTVRAHAANLLDLRPGDGLFVGDDGQRFRGRRGKGAWITGLPSFSIQGASSGLVTSW